MENEDSWCATGKENHIGIQILSKDIRTSRIHRLTATTTISYQPPTSESNPLGLRYSTNRICGLRPTTSSKLGGNSVGPRNRNSGYNTHLNDKSRNQNQLPSPIQSRPTSILNNSVTHSLPVSLQRQQSSKMQQLHRGQGHLGLRKGDLLTKHLSVGPLPQASLSSISISSSKIGSGSLRISTPSPVNVFSPTPAALPSGSKIPGVDEGDDKKSTPVTGAAVAQDQGYSEKPTLVNFPYYCHSCCAVVLTPIAFEHHLRSHQVNVIVAYGCSTCKARFSTQSGRDQHLSVVHNGDGNVQGRNTSNLIQPDNDNDGDEIQIIAEIPRTHPPTSSIIYNDIDEENEEKGENNQSSNQNTETAPLELELELEEPSLCYLCGHSYTSLQSLNLHIFEEHVVDHSSDIRMTNTNSGGQTEIRNDTSSSVTFVNVQGVIKLEPEPVPETTEKIIISKDKDNERRRRRRSVQDSIKIKTTSLKGPGRRKKFRCRHCGIGFPTFTAARLHVTSVHKFRNIVKRKAFKGRTHSLKK